MWLPLQTMQRSQQQPQGLQAIVQQLVRLVSQSTQPEPQAQLQTGPQAQPQAQPPAQLQTCSLAQPQAQLLAVLPTQLPARSRASGPKAQRQVPQSLAPQTQTQGAVSDILFGAGAGTHAPAPPHTQSIENPHQPNHHTLTSTYREVAVCHASARSNLRHIRGRQHEQPACMSNCNS